MQVIFYGNNGEPIYYYNRIKYIFFDGRLYLVNRYNLITPIWRDEYNYFRVID